MHEADREAPATAMTPELYASMPPLTVSVEREPASIRLALIRKLPGSSAALGTMLPFLELMCLSAIRTASAARISSSRSSDMMTATLKTHPPPSPSPIMPCGQPAASASISDARSAQAMSASTGSSIGCSVNGGADALNVRICLSSPGTSSSKRYRYCCMSLMSLLPSGPNATVPVAPSNSSARILLAAASLTAAMSAPGGSLATASERPYATVHTASYAYAAASLRALNSGPSLSAARTCIWDHAGASDGGRKESAGVATSISQSLSSPDMPSKTRPPSVP
mmetsp:Transcript_31463/g.74762  ORF Transcript_31463/g.74762 Transcript_31463/m.74762 type:complete len:282 (+) Transcript_31463:5032-5877(+)